ncbi:MAG: hypothetical protein HGA67_01165 [Candidatus Yonathbacteria bacterium]|nr:hypothetical protein [Candidatus Yonathbacteria bacterium]
MDSITSFLARFAHISPSNDARRERCGEVIGELSGVIIEKKDIHIRGNTIVLSCRSGKKNEIMLHKKEILESLNTPQSDIVFTSLL